MTAIRRGLVSFFDDERGLGRVADEDGSELPFHCTAIADGTRTIAVGTPVVFELKPGRLGVIEATAVTAR